MDLWEGPSRWHGCDVGITLLLVEESELSAACRTPSSSCVPKEQLAVRIPNQTCCVLSQASLKVNRRCWLAF